jgi:SAM-dependent methyltransferase
VAALSVATARSRARGGLSKKREALIAVPGRQRTFRAEPARKFGRNPPGAETHHLIGVDMSEPMLAQARQKNVYNELHRDNPVEYLAGHPRSCDVLVSAATLIHFGDLDAVFEAAAKCLRAGGLFVLTAFPNDDDPGAVAIGTLNGLAQGGCFRHGQDYIVRLAAKHGYEVALLSREVMNMPARRLFTAYSSRCALPASRHRDSIGS